MLLQEFQYHYFYLCAKFYVFHFLLSIRLFLLRYFLQFEFLC